jgi:hypothetical protein
MTFGSMTLGLWGSGGRGTVAPGPINTVAPEITGVTELGETLTCSTGTWTGTGTISYAYQWLRDGIEIPTETANTFFAIEPTNENTFISCRVTATDDEGSRSRMAAAVGPILGDPFNLVLPAITGTVEVGQTLTCSTGTWQGIAPITYGFVWRADNIPIDGATSATYELTADEYGAMIDCVVMATNDLNSVEAEAVAVGPVPGVAPSIDGVPTIAGTEAVGSTLTATAATAAGVPTPSRTWQWTRDGVDIGGATSITYLLDPADEGALIRVRQIETNAIDTATATSLPTGAIAEAAAFDIYVDSVAGNDTNPGTLAEPLATWSATKTAADTFGAGVEIGVAGGSHFRESLLLASGTTNAVIRAYGAGARPIFDASRIIAAGTIQPHETYADVYYSDVTQTTSTSGGANGSNTFHIGLWEDEDLLTGQFASETIDTNVQAVRDNPGTFTAHKVGSTTADPRVDTGGTDVTYRYYFHLADSGDPRSNGAVMAYAAQTPAAVFGNDHVWDGLEFRRSAGKDMTGMVGNYAGGGTINDCVFRDPGCHGGVLRPSVFSNNFIYGRSDGRSVVTGGGGMNFYFLNTSGVSVPITITGNYAENVRTGFYSHGSNSNAVHNSITGDSNEARDCTVGWSIARTQNGMTCENFTAINCNTGLIAAADDSAIVFEGVTYLAPSENGVGIGLRGNATVRQSSFVFLGGASPQAFQNIIAQENLDDTEVTITLENCSFKGALRPNNARWRQVTMIATDSVIGDLAVFSTDDPITGIVAENSYLSEKRRSIADMVAAGATIDAASISPWRGGVNYLSTDVVWAGTPDEDGVAVIASSSVLYGLGMGRNAVTLAIGAPALIASPTTISVTYQENDGTKTFDGTVNFTVPRDFYKTSVTWSLDSPPTGVTINASTGVVTVDTDTTGALTASTITIRATNDEGTVTDAASVTVTAAPSLGPDLAVNGTFDTDVSGWTLVSGALDWESPGRAKFTRSVSGDRCWQSYAVDNGASYFIEFEVADTSNQARVDWRANTNAPGSGNIVNNVSAAASYAVTLTATATTMYIVVTAAQNGIVPFDNVRVRKVL